MKTMCAYERERQDEYVYVKNQVGDRKTILFCKCYRAMLQLSCSAIPVGRKEFTTGKDAEQNERDRPEEDNESRDLGQNVDDCASMGDKYPTVEGDNAELYESVGN